MRLPDKDGRKMQIATFGPAVPLVPVGDFSRLPAEVIEPAWYLVGPSVLRNLNSARNVPPLWMIFAACYAEGVNHGAGLMREKMEAERTWTPPSEP